VNTQGLAVIFDMDGLMLDTERVAMQAWKGAAAANGLDLPDDVYCSLIGRPDAECRLILEGHRWTTADIDRLETEAREEYLSLLEREGVPIKPGLFEVLDYLDAHAIPRAVATSTHTHLARQKLERVGAISRLPIIVGGDQVARGKPAPDIYLLAAERLACPASRCLALEDSPVGVRAASAAGMPVILVPDLAPIDAEIAGLAAAVVSSLSEAIQTLQRLVR